MPEVALWPIQVLPFTGSFAYCLEPTLLEIAATTRRPYQSFLFPTDQETLAVATRVCLIFPEGFGASAQIFTSEGLMSTKTLGTFIPSGKVFAFWDSTYTDITPLPQKNSKSLAKVRPLLDIK
jgi:hypothetical protein